MHILLGLGNPGTKYSGTLHNIGFELVEALVDGSDSWRKEGKALTQKSRLGHHPVLLAKPQTYMNLSGEAAQSLCAYYKVLPQNLVVLVDDINLQLGSLRIRASGGHGGHNGLRNIIQHLGEGFPRLRIGAGLCPPGWDLASFVLKKYGSEEEEAIRELSDLVRKAISCGLEEGWEKAASKYNRTVR